MNESGQTTLADYVRTLKRSRWLILGLMLICAGAALVYSLLQTPTYEATAQLTVRDPAQDLNLVGGAAVTVQQPLQLASGHAPQVTRAAVVERVKNELNRDQPLTDIRELVGVEIDPNSFTVLIRAQSSDAREAARIVNAFAEADARLSSSEARKRYASAADRLSERLKDLDAAKNSTTKGFYINRLSNLQVLSSVAEPVTVSDLAEVPESPVSPKPFRNTLAAGVFGLLLGLLLAYARGIFDRRLREPSDVEELFEYPVLARFRGTVFGHTGSEHDLEMPGLGFLDPLDAEAFRMLRENLRFLSVDRDLRKIAVTSATPEEGKSSVAACLAMAYAAGGTSTLLVECDLRRRVLANRFGLTEAPGLSDYLVARSAPVDVLQLVQVPGAGSTNGSDAASLVCITAGSPPPRPADILSSDRFADFLDKVQHVYERVIIDCPPLLPVADTLQIIPHADCVLMCVRLNQTTRDKAGAARVALDRLPPRPTGLVITDFTERDIDSYGAYYYPGDAVPAAREGDQRWERAGAGSEALPPAG